MVDNEIIEIDGKKIQTRLLRHWTGIALECYKRDCNCYNCNIVPKESFHEKCNIKYYVKGYFLIGNYPKEEQRVVEGYTRKC